MTNRERFAAKYTEELERAVAERPDEYRWTDGKTPKGVAGRMTELLAKGGANKESPAIRRTCKALEVPYTYKGIQAFLTS